MVSPVEIHGRVDLRVGGSGRRSLPSVNRTDLMSVDVGNPSNLVGHERAVEVDDSVLWSRAGSGDSEAFGLLFERHGPTIYNSCVRRAGSWAVAEDLVSIVFLEAWRRVYKQLPMFIGSWAALMLTELCYGRFSFFGRS
jgi:sigma-70-like protein